jgi:nucleoside-diphosphate-sugar epimerase
VQVLIAGCGDVGNVLAASLLQDGQVVYGLKRDTSTLPDGVQAIQADLTNPDTLINLPMAIDRLVFMPTSSSRDPAGYEAIFIQGWKNLWASLKQPPVRSLLVSSTAVFGQSDGGVVNEQTHPEPTGFNGKILLKMEQIATACTEDLVVVRFSGIYGPGRERLIRQSVSKGLEIQRFPPYFTNRIHRDDAAEVLKHLLQIDQPEALYLASDNQPAPRYDVVKWLAGMQGSAAPTGLNAHQASCGKRVDNQRLLDSGFVMSYPDYRAGYAAVLKTSEK